MKTLQNINYNNTTIMYNDFAINSIIKGIDVCSRINHMCTYIIDFENVEIIYKSEKFACVEETMLKYRQRNCINPFWTLVADDIFEMLKEISRYYPLAGKEITVEDYSKTTFIIDYPIMVGKKEIFITQKLCPLSLRDDGTIKYGMFSIRLTSKKSIKSVIITSSGIILYYDSGKKKFVEYDEDMILTRIEKYILVLARIGMSNEEISKSLYITINTVKTHRASIFRKLKAKNITEALAMADKYQLL